MFLYPLSIDQINLIFRRLGDVDDVMLTKKSDAFVNLYQKLHRNRRSGIASIKIWPVFIFCDHFKKQSFFIQLSLNVCFENLSKVRFHWSKLTININLFLFLKKVLFKYHRCLQTVLHRRESNVYVANTSHNVLYFSFKDKCPGLF